MSYSLLYKERESESSKPQQSMGQVRKGWLFEGSSGAPRIYTSLHMGTKGGKPRQRGVWVYVCR
jgi:hypothetical protein